MGSEPEVLRRGKEFHRLVQRDWRIDAEGNVLPEETIRLLPVRGRHRRRGRIDIFVDDLDGLVVVVEIKSTEWDAIAPGNRRRLVARHRRQVWKYVDKFLDEDGLDVVPGIIYPSAPRDPEARHEVEKHHNDFGVQVVWYDELPEANAS